MRADLHVHTVLSPCASEEMTPPAIVLAALSNGIEMIAITDHNSARNAAAVQEAAGEDMAVLAGIEIMTAEEVHVLGIFPSLGEALAASEEVRSTLPDATPGDAGRFGEQKIADVLGRVTGKETKLLAAACGFDLSDAVRLIKRHGGIAVAAHVDRPAFGVFGQLGFFPEDAGFDAIEISACGARQAWTPDIEKLGLPVLRSSDAHYLSELGGAWTRLQVAEPTFEEFAMAISGADGRRVL